MPVDVEDERLLGVDARDGPEPVVGEELLLVEEPREEPQHPPDPDDAEQHRAGRRAPPVAGCAARSMSAARLLTVSARSTTFSSIAATPRSGSTPTIERTRIGTSLPSGRRSRS